MMGGCGTNSLNGSRSLSFTTQEYASCRSISKNFDQTVWKPYNVYSDAGSWYPEACNSLGLKHVLHSPFEKKYYRKVKEIRKGQNTEGFDDYYPCMKKKDFYCSLSHVHKSIH